MEHDSDVKKCVGIIAADVQANGVPDCRAIPKRIDQLRAVLTVVHEARLPSNVLDSTFKDGPHNVVDIPWGGDKRRVLESLLECAKLHGNRVNASKLTKKHAALMQNVLKRVIDDLVRREILRAQIDIMCARKVFTQSAMVRSLPSGLRSWIASYITSEVDAIPMHS